MTDNHYFTATQDGFAPTPISRGPWSPDLMHGRLLAGLAARALDVRDGSRVTRLTVDLFRPAPMELVTVRTEPVRQGRKVQVVDAVVSIGGHDVARVTALLLVTSESPQGTIWRPDHEAWPDPESLPAPDDGTGSAEHNQWLFRVVSGGMGSGQQSAIWTNDTAELVEGEAMSPLVRAAVSGDIACPLANFSDQGLHFINADYTMTLARYPDGDWIGIETAEQLQADGVSIASATLRDEKGPFGLSGGTSLTRPPLRHDVAPEQPGTQSP